MTSLERDRKQAFIQLLLDYLAASVSWFLFFSYRKFYIEKFPYHTPWNQIYDQNFLLGMLFIPVFWLILYQTNGTYYDVYRRSRLGILWQTAAITALGSLVIFFALLLDDTIENYKTYYSSLSALFLIHFGIVGAQRMIVASRIALKIHQRKIGFKTILIGSGPKAVQLLEEFNDAPISSGNLFIGYIPVNGEDPGLLLPKLTALGNIDKVLEIIHRHDVEEVIIAPENSEHAYMEKLITRLQTTNVIIKIIPDVYELLLNSVKMTAIFSAPVVEIKHTVMPSWQRSVKRLIDVVCSMLMLTLFSWLYLLLALLVKITSKGPVFYSHFRVGLNGKPFKMYKFRSMYANAEHNGPQLSSKDDKRITPFGRFMRKTRLDEIPQFYNVLIGQMSIVGPRPERQYYIDQIVNKAPHFLLLHKVRPGITGWGQVKFGYAENVDEMIVRLKYDILYIENMSLALDLKIIIYTILIVLQGRGK